MFQRKTVADYLVVIFFFCFTAGLLVSKPAFAQKLPRRIVSLAPSITEILFALGAGDKVVGVTRFCDYPPSVKHLSKVGGLTDPNYEAIVGLRPDLVIIFGRHAGAHEKLKKLSLNVLSVEQETVEQILNSINTIAIAVNSKIRGDKLRRKIEQDIDNLKEKVSSLEKPRVMVTVGGHYSDRTLDKVYIAGRNTFYDELIELAGGINIYRDREGYPSVSAEGLLNLNPDVIIDLEPNTETRKVDTVAVLNLWKTLSTLSAVKNNRVYVITDEYAMNPGPRLVLALKKFAEVLHPELSETL